jgi:hypothetical protein
MARTATTITLSAVHTACVKLSKYVGREQRDGSGESLYEQILIQSRDYDLIDQYATEAAVELNKWLLPFCTLSVTSTALTWTWDPTYDIPMSFDNLIEKYIVNWAMGMWCGDKVAERAEYFKSEAERLGASLPPKIFRAKPE